MVDTLPGSLPDLLHRPRRSSLNGPLHGSLDNNLYDDVRQNSRWHLRCNLAFPQAHCMDAFTLASVAPCIHLSTSLCATPRGVSVLNACAVLCQAL
eukprot:15447243-Alexandrium_andersonii.AAC.1